MLRSAAVKNKLVRNYEEKRKTMKQENTKNKVQEKPSFKRKSERYARRKQRQKFVNYLRSELRTTTTHSLPYIVDTGLHWFERLFWAVSFLTSATIAVYLLSAQYLRFVETPSVMSLEMDYFNWNVSYPAITLCPTEKSTTETFEQLSNETLMKTGLDLSGYLKAIVTAGMDTLELLDLNTPSVVSLIDPKEYAFIAAAAFKTFNDEALTTNMNWPISVDDIMTELGMCHVINSNVAVFDSPFKWSSDFSAKYTKSNIEISVYERDFFTQIISYAEVYKIFIHNPDEIALSTTQSYTHSIKGYLSFGVHVVINRISNFFRQVPISVRKCSSRYFDAVACFMGELMQADDSLIKGKRIYLYALSNALAATTLLSPSRFINEPISKRYPVYSYNHCLLECRIKMILRLCGCIPHFYKPLDHEKVCDISRLKCVITYKKEIMSLATTEQTRNRFGELPKSSKDCGCLSSCEIDIYQKDFEDFMPQEDLSRLRVGISTFPKFRIVRDIIFSFDDIVLKIGGVINLCIGTSIISLVELLIIAIRTAIQRLNEFCKKSIRTKFPNMSIKLK